MTSQREFDRLLDIYFDDGRDELADRVIDAALSEIDHTRQRRAMRVPWRSRPMTMPFRLATAALIGALVLGGAFLLTGGGSRPSTVVPNPTPTAVVTVAPTPASAWRVTGSPALDHGWHGVAIQLTDGRILLAGGITGTSVALTEAELYDPATGTWTTTGSMTTPRSYPTASLLANGKVLVAGGSSNNGATAAAEIYDPATGTWSATGFMTESRNQAIAATLADGRVLMAGGNADDGRGTAELYDPTTGTWTATGDMATWRAGPVSAVRLRDGRVLVAGGFVTDVRSTELFDPKTGTWAKTGPMTTGRADGQSALLLADGTVLMTEVLPAVDRYDPVVGTWSAAAPLGQSVADLVALSQLGDGTVLLVGGGTGGSTATSQVYDPAADAWSTAGTLTTTRVIRAAFTLPDGTVLVIGSSSADAGGTPSAELYEPTP